MPDPLLKIFPPYIYVPGISRSIQPPSSLQTSDIRKRSVSYRFTASPTSGVTYKVIFTHQRADIPQPTTDTFDSVSPRTKSGLVPDVTYRIQVVAVKGDEESAASSVAFTTKPDGKTAVKDKYAHVKQIESSVVNKCLVDVCRVTAWLL